MKFRRLLDADATDISASATFQFTLPRTQIIYRTGKLIDPQTLGVAWHFLAVTRAMPDITAGRR